MHKQTSKVLLSAIRQIVITTKGKVITTSLIEEIQDSIAPIKEFFEITDYEAIILSMYINCAIKDNSVVMDRLIDHFGKDISMLSELNDTLDKLMKRRILVLKRQEYSSKRKSNFYKELQLSNKAMDSIVKGDKSILEPAKVENFISVLYEVRELIVRRIDKEIESEQLVEEIFALLEINKRFSEVQWILSLEGLSSYDVIIMLDLAIEHFEGADDVDLDKIIGEIFSEVADRVRYKRSIKEDRNPLFKLGYIEYPFEEIAFLNYVRLTEEPMDIFLGGYHESIKKKFIPKMGEVILSERIKTEQLFYNCEEQEQIELLIDALSESNYENLMEELENTGMRKGFTTLFYGFPGTGKTSSVKQIAKKTNRQIFMVEIAKVQSKWVGESEKNISKIFEEYKRFKKSCKQVPILLFNEADAILGKRFKVYSSVDKSFNTIQNLLLQELEDFEGIFMATTNLADQLDDAFDRRLLYKVEFKKPSHEIRCKILKNNFNNITDELLDKLSTYSLTGGQIANIKKKILIKNILRKPANQFDSLLELCEEELSLTKSRVSNPIGFYQ